MLRQVPLLHEQRLRQWHIVELIALFKRICGKLADVAIAFMDFDVKSATVINNDEFLAKFD